MRRAAAFALLAACASGGKPYPNDLPEKNVSIRSTLAGVRGALHLHSVDTQCRTEYLGSLELDRPAVAVGIPADRPTYLVFDFSSSSFLRGRGRITQETLLQPRARHRYEIVATYRDDIYNVVVREAPPQGAARELPLRGLASCRVR